MGKKETKEKVEKQEVINPIDPDKITETPHNLPYAHNVGGSIIKPIDRGRVKGQAVSAMYEQADMQLDQIREQVQLLADQAKMIQKRVEVSELIYQSEMNFKPLMGHTYHLYRKSNDEHILSMVAPKEWGSNMPYEFVATVKLLSDHTWEMQEGHFEQTTVEV